jgi:hypothetical protein
VTPNPSIERGRRVLHLNNNSDNTTSPRMGAVNSSFRASETGHSVEGEGSFAAETKGCLVISREAECIEDEVRAHRSRLMAHGSAGQGTEEEGRRGMRWMPWRCVPKKDVGSCEKRWGADTRL